MRKIDKDKDKPAEPKGDLVLDKMKTINGNYKDNIEDDIKDLGKYGHIHALSGDFVFHHCKNCDGPMIGHEKEENQCKENKIDRETIEKLQDKVREHYMFNTMKSAIDKRAKEILCNECEKTFTNRLEREEHDKSLHSKEKREKTKEIDLETILSGFAGTLKDVSGTLKDVSGTIKDVMINNTEKKTM